MTAKTATDPEKGHAEEIDEVEAILAEPQTIEIVGVLCEVKRMRTRELMKLMKIVTTGMGGGLAFIEWDTEDEQELIGQLTAVVLNAFPEAENEVIAFLNAMIEPVSGIPKKKAAAFRKEMQNPELSVTMELVKIVIEQEASELTALGKEAVNWWKATGVIKKIKKTTG